MKAETPANDAPRFTLRKLRRADALGLVGVWSREFGHVSIHDPNR